MTIREILLWILIAVVAGLLVHAIVAIVRAWWRKHRPKPRTQFDALSDKLIANQKKEKSDNGN